MKVFDKYAEYYDLLYRDKDYFSEANFVHQIIQQHCPTAKTILDLGCGTGNHAFPLADLGYAITGIDNSKINIEIAHTKLYSKEKNNATMRFKLADIRDIYLQETFDAVISLFHVMSYQINDEDIKAALNTAKKHLSYGGVFIFDCWYGPAVLADPPQVRVKRVENEKTRVIRIAGPKMIPDKNLVEINYQIEVEDKATMRTNSFSEKHRMRYFFQSEIGNMLKGVGLKSISCNKWMTNNSPDHNTWNVYFINNHSS